MKESLSRLIIISFCFVIFFSCDTEETVPPLDIFYKLYGGTGDHQGVEAVKVADGFIILGNAESQSGKKSIFLVKTDDRGNELWTKKFGGSRSAEANSMDLDDNGNLIISSTIESEAGSNTDVMFLWLDSNGAKLDSAIYGSDIYDEVAGQVISASDGSFLMIGTSWDRDDGVNKIQILRTIPGTLDTLSNNVWRNEYKWGTRDFGVSIAEKNGLFYCFGYTDSDDVEGQGQIDGFRYLIFRLDQEGDGLGQRTYGSTADETAISMLETEGGFVLLGNSTQDGNSIFIVPVSDELAGIPFFLEANKQLIANKIIDLGISYLILGTEIVSGVEDTNIYLTNIDKAGGLIWENSFGGIQSQDRAGNSILQLPDGRLGIVGTIDLDNQTKMCLMKLNEDGKLKP